MKRYLSRERALSPEEQLASYRMRVREAAEDLRQAQLRLTGAIEAEPPATTTDYIEVKPGEPGYEDAPFVNSMIMRGREMAEEVASRPSPWIAMVERGVYPAGLSTT